MGTSSGGGTDCETFGMLGRGSGDADGLFTCSFATATGLEFWMDFFQFTRLLHRHGEHIDHGLDCMKCFQR